MPGEHRARQLGRLVDLAGIRSRRYERRLFERREQLRSAEARLIECQEALEAAGKAIVALDREREASLARCDGEALQRYAESRERRVLWRQQCRGSLKEAREALDTARALHARALEDWRRSRQRGETLESLHRATAGSTTPGRSVHGSHDR